MLLGILAGAAGASQAALTPFFQNFETMNAASGTALSADGWKVFGNVFDGSGGYQFGYGTFAAPNGTGAFSAVASGEGGAAQGMQYLNTFSDYLNMVHLNNPTWRIESNVFQEQVVAAGDLGTTWNFTFDYKASSQFGPGGQTETRAFIKVLNPGAGFSLVAFPNLVTTLASPTTWASGSLSVTIDSSWTGHILQFGFMNTVNNYQPSGVFYDNVSFQTAAAPTQNLNGTLLLNNTTSSFAVNRTISYSVVQGTATLASGSVVVGSASSALSLPVPASASGTAQIVLDGASFLKRRVNVTLTGSNQNVGSIAMNNGDVDNNGEVDLTDVDLVIADYLTSGGNTVGTITDLDCSGEVDLTDIDVAIASYLLSDDN